MGILGFPTPGELVSMMGYVTEEDRNKWDQMKESSDKHREAGQGGLTAKNLASRSLNPALGMAEKSINAQIHGEQMAERERRRREDEVQVEVTEKRTSFRPRFDSGSQRSTGTDPEMGF